ncbi:MAG: hypothetical protein AAGF77_08805 [Bacteroidota bacterium]
MQALALSKHKHYFLIVAFLCCSVSQLSAQTTVNLEDQCNCEVLKGTDVTVAGATIPVATTAGDLYVNTDSGTIFFWDGDSWELTASDDQNAQEVSYDNTLSRLAATNVQEALDELGNGNEWTNGNTGSTDIIFAQQAFDNGENVSISDGGNLALGPVDETTKLNIGNTTGVDKAIQLEGAQQPDLYLRFADGRRFWRTDDANATIGGYANTLSGRLLRTSALPDQTQSWNNIVKTDVYIEEGHSNNATMAILDNNIWEPASHNTRIGNWYGKTVNLRKRGQADFNNQFGSFFNIWSESGANGNVNNAAPITSKISLFGGSTNYNRIRLIHLENTLSGGWSGTIGDFYGLDVMGISSNRVTNSHGIQIGAIRNATGSNYGLRIGNVSGGANAYAIYTGDGDVRLGGLVDDTDPTNKVVVADTDGVLKTIPAANLIASTNDNPWDNPDGTVATQSSTDINFMNGNVGIGDSTPDTTLDVNGGDTEPQLHISGGANGPNSVYGMNARGNAAGAFFGYMGNSATGPTGAAIVAGDDKNMTFFTQKSNAERGDALNVSSANNIPRLVILKNSGFVGIDINAPRTLLHLKRDNAAFRISSDATNVENSSRIQFEEENTGDGFELLYDGRNRLTPTGTANGTLRFRELGSGNEIMALLRNGLVGLGTIDPTEKIDVDGTARLRGLTDDTNPANKIVVADTDGVLKTATTATIAPMANVFTPPAVPVSITITETGRTLDLHQTYLDFYSSPLVSNPSAGSLPTYTESELDYFVLDYDTAVFSNVTLNDAGLLTFDIISVPPSNTADFTVVFKVK